MTLECFLHTKILHQFLLQIFFLPHILMMMVIPTVISTSVVGCYTLGLLPVILILPMFFLCFGNLFHIPFSLNFQQSFSFYISLYIIFLTICYNLSIAFSSLILWNTFILWNTLQTLETQMHCQETSNAKKKLDNHSYFLLFLFG